MIPPGPWPPVLECDAPRMGNPIGDEVCASERRSDKPLGEA